MLLVSTIAGCAAGGADDPADGAFLGPDAIAPSVACSVLKLANTASTAELTGGAHITKTAAAGIAAYRAGPDGKLGTADDRWFTTLAELDAVPYIGPATYAKLQAHATATAADACGTVPLQILAFNDFHGQLTPPTGSSAYVQTGPGVVEIAGGVEFLASHLAALRTGHANTITVEAGDVIGASPLISAEFDNEPSIEAMNALGLDLASVGNHEFDKGPAELLRMQHGGCVAGGCAVHPFTGARFEYLSANVVTTATGETLFPAYAIRTFGNVRVGFIGLTLTGTPTIVVQSGTAGLTFLDEATAINGAVAALRAQGVGTFIVLLHQGGYQTVDATTTYNTCTGLVGDVLPILGKLDPDVKVVVSAHSHAAYNCTVDGRIVTQAASFGRLITDLELVLDETTGAISTATATNVVVSRDVAPDPTQSAILAIYAPMYAAVANQIVGSIAGDIREIPDLDGETPLGDLIADAQLDTTAVAGAQISFMNEGGVRADLLYSQISAGEAPGQVTYAEAFAVEPFANQLVTVSMTGDQLHAMLEQQWATQADGSVTQTTLFVSHGFAYAFDAAAPPGARIQPSSMTLDGAPIQPGASYRVTVSDYLSAGGDGFTTFAASTNVTPGGVDLDAVVEYLGDHPAIAPPITNRVTQF